MREYPHITILSQPIEANWSQWLVDHPDCDTICEDVETGETIRVYAFASSQEGNRELGEYRNLQLAGIPILKGLSSYAIAGII